MMERDRRLDQRVKKLSVNAFGLQPDFLPRFVALEKLAGVEQFDPAQVLNR
jgi:hypothetical protein